MATFLTCGWEMQPHETCYLTDLYILYFLLYIDLMSGPLILHGLQLIKFRLYNNIHVRIVILVNCMDFLLDIGLDTIALSMYKMCMSLFFK